MATDAATLILKVDSTDVRKGVTELDKLTAAGSRAENAAAQFAAKAQAMGDKLIGVGKKMSLGLTLPLAAFGIGAFNAAKDAAELDSAFATTFGSMTETMHKWADETGNALGRSTREMKEAANTFGIFFNTAVNPAKAAEMSRTFAVLAQDLSSFFNVDTQVAIEKLRSGLAGETEPLRAFGVFLTEATVRAKALELGLMGVGNELTEQEKITARYALILEQTAKAQGDVQRTSEGTANQIREAKAAWEELQIIVGTKLLPAITPLIEKVAALLTWFTQLPEPVQATVIGLAAFSAAAGPVIMVVGGLLKVLGPLLPLIVSLGPAVATLRVALLALFMNPVVLGAAALITGIYIAWRNWDKIESIVGRTVSGVTKWLDGQLKGTLDRARKNIDDLRNAFWNLYDKVIGRSYVPDLVDGIEGEFGRLQQVMVVPAVAATGEVNQAFEAMSAKSPFQQWAETIPQTMAAVKEAVEGIAVRGFDSLSAAITDVIMGAQSLGEAFSNVARQIIADIIQMTIRMLIFRAISGMFGGGGGLTGQAAFNATSGLPGFAKGGAFLGGNVIPFASGGVVSGPMMFPMSGGRTGLMGEAGPEAIMPLARDSSGRLGVRAANDSGKIEVHVVVDTSDDLMVKAAVVADARIRAHEPRIVKSAANATMRAAGRRPLMGRGPM